MKCETCGSELSGMMPTCPFCGTPDPVYMRRYRQYPPSQGSYPPPGGNYPPPPPPQRNYPPPNINQPPYRSGWQPYDPTNEAPEVMLVILAVLVPLVGVIYGSVCLGNGEKRAGKAYLLAAGISIGAWVLLTLFFVLVGFLAAANR